MMTLAKPNWKGMNMPFGTRPMAMTVDVEDYFQVGAFFDCISPSEWSRFEQRVTTNTNKLLDLYAKHNMKATFFILGWVAEHCPELIKRIHENGHEIASHGYGHQRVCGLDAKSFKADIEKAKSLLEDLTGAAVLGYRAPCFSINAKTPWAFDLLAEAGHRYSSSTYPVKHDHYGTPDWPATPFIDRTSGILELPQAVAKFGKRNIPAGGGGYFRLFPNVLNKQLIKTFHEQFEHPYIFYCHPWEIDPQQPRIRQASLKSKFRHYVNQASMLNKIDKLCTWGPWKRLDALYLPWLEAKNTVDIKCVG